MAIKMDSWQLIRGELTGMTSLATHTVCSIVALLIMSCFLGKYVKITRKGVLLLNAFFVLAGCVNLIELVMMFRHPPDNARQGMIDLTMLFYGTYFVICLFLYKKKRFWRALESAVVCYAFHQYLTVNVLNVFSLIMGNPVAILTRIGSVWDPLSFYFYGSMLIVSLVSLVIFYFGFYRKELFLRLKLQELILLVAWIVIMLFFGGLATGMYAYEVRKFSLAALMPLLSIFMPIFLLMNRYRNLLRDKNVYQQTYLDAELAYVEQYKKSQTQTRAFRHDVINQLSLLSMLMKEGKMNEAKEQVEQLLGEVKDLSPKYVTGDQMLDCIMAMKAAKMEEQGIAFRHDGVADGGLGLKPMDVCGIFANAFDNAIEAVSRVDANEKKWIDFQIKRTGKFFVVKISNATAGKADVEKMFEGTGYTMKKDADHHGFGLRNIRSAVERYDGLIKADAEDGRFSLSVMIPRDGRKDDGTEEENVKKMP